MSNLVSLNNVCAVVAAEGDVEELVVIAQLPEACADVCLEVVPAEIQRKSIKFLNLSNLWLHKYSRRNLITIVILTWQDSGPGEAQVWARQLGKGIWLRIDKVRQV